MRLALAFATTLAACNGLPAPEPSAAPDAPAEQPEVDPLAPPWRAPDDAEPVACAAAPHVQITYGHTLPGELPCPDPLSCSSPYLELLRRPDVDARLPERPDCEAELQQWMATTEGTGMVWDEVYLEPGQSLGDALVQTSGWGFLFEPDAFWQRPLHVVELSRSVQASPTGAEYELRELVMMDPYVGLVDAQQLLPLDPPGPVPTVVVLPGHDDTADDHRLNRFGQFLPESGFGALILSFRAWDEHADPEVTAAMLCRGASFMMLRGYEAMLATKVALALEEGCGRPIGLLGHSGGAATANLLAWLDINPAVVHVVDLETDYRGLRVDGWYGTAFDCEFHPGLAAHSWMLNDFDRAPRAVSMVPYGYPTEPDAPPEPDDLRALEHFVPTLTDYLLVETPAF